MWELAYLFYSLLLISLEGAKNWLHMASIGLALFVVLFVGIAVLLLKYMREKNTTRQNDITMRYTEPTQSLTINFYNDEGNNQNGYVHYQQVVL